MVIIIMTIVRIIIINYNANDVIDHDNNIIKIIK